MPPTILNSASFGLNPGILGFRNFGQGIAITMEQGHTVALSEHRGERSAGYAALVSLVADTDRTRRGNIHGPAQPPHTQLAGASFSSGGDRGFSVAYGLVRHSAGLLAAQGLVQYPSRLLAGKRPQLRLAWSGAKLRRPGAWLSAVWFTFLDGRHGRRGLEAVHRDRGLDWPHAVVHSSGHHQPGRGYHGSRLACLARIVTKDVSGRGRSGIRQAAARDTIRSGAFTG